MPGITDFEQAHDILHKSISKSAKARDISEAIKLLPLLQATNLEKEECDLIIDDLNQVFLVPNFIKTEKGRKFMISVFLLHINHIKEFTQTIREALKTSPQNATLIGEIAANAWTNANIQERARIETVLLKDIIDCAILAVSPTINKNCRLFMEPFHSRRRRKELSSTLVHLYEPVIFRYLHAANPIVRLNSLMIFASAFPLQSPQFSADRNTNLLQEQISELLQCLFDESPKVRASAAKSVCRILYEWWEIFDHKIRVEFIQKLTNELCYDASSSNVRAAVIEGIDYLLGRFESIELIMPHLPTMGYLLHDPVESVRIQFVKLLITMNPLTNINIFKIVHIDHLIYRLKIDTQRCAKAICQLLQPSFFPPPKSKGKERTCNTKRVARCIFLLERNLSAAERFYSLLPKFVSTDEIICFLRFAYFWAQRTVKGKPPKLPTIKLVGDDDLTLPAFKDGNDLERLGFEPHQAIWVIISSLTGYLARKAQNDLNDIKNQTFPNFDAKSVLNYLPQPLHPSLFKFISYFEPEDNDIKLTLQYLQSDENEGWSDALRCLIQWNVLNSFFSKLVQTITNFGEVDKISSNELSSAINHLSFIFSNSELRKAVIQDLDNIKALSDGLNKFLKMLLIRLNLPFDGSEDVDDNTNNLAEALPEDCYIHALELMITLRVHLSIQILNDNDEEAFHSFLEVIKDSIITPITRGILSVYNSEGLQENMLTFKALKTMLTLVADMISLHIFEDDSFYILLETYTDIIDSENDYGDSVKTVGYECLAKIVMSIAVDMTTNEDQVHPAKPILSKMINNANTKDTIAVVKDLLDSLVKLQVKKKCMPWLKGSLGDLFVADEVEEENNGKNEEEEEDSDPRSTKYIRKLITDAILKLSD